jgi:hypothetical protein
MDKTDQYIKQRLQSSAAKIEPPKTGRYRLLQEAKQNQNKNRRKLPRMLDLVEYEQIHGQGLTYPGLGYSFESSTIGLLKLV